MAVLLSAAGRVEERYFSPYSEEITRANVYRDGDKATVLRPARPWPLGTWYDKNGKEVEVDKGCSWINPGEYTNEKLPAFGAEACAKALKRFEEEEFTEGDMATTEEKMGNRADLVARSVYKRGGSTFQDMWPSVAYASTLLEKMQKFGRSMLKVFASHVDCEDDLGNALKGLRSSLSIELTVSTKSAAALAKHLKTAHCQLKAAFKAMMDVLRPNTEKLDKGLSCTWDDFDSIVRWCIAPNEFDAADTPGIIRSHDVFHLGHPSPSSAINVRGKPVEDAKLSICSFNMMDFGDPKNRDIKAISEHLKEHDIVVLQELMSPLVCGAYTHGAKDAYAPQGQVARDFHALMSETHVFSQSRDKTGPSEGPVTQSKSVKGAEFFGIYYNPQKVSVTAQGFIHSEVVGKENFRHSHNYTPYVWELRHLQSTDGNGRSTERKFNVAGVHFAPGDEPAVNISRRNQLTDVLKELMKMSVPFIIAGDFNFSSVAELDDTITAAAAAVEETLNPLAQVGANAAVDDGVGDMDDTGDDEAGDAAEKPAIPMLISANFDGVSTNLFGGKPYDHIMRSKGIVCSDFKVHRFEHFSDDAERYVELRGEKKKSEKAKTYAAQNLAKRRKKTKVASTADSTDWSELDALDKMFKSLKPTYGDHCPVSCTIEISP